MEDKNLVLMKFLDIEFKREPVPLVRPHPFGSAPVHSFTFIKAWCTSSVYLEFISVFRSLNK